MTRVVDVNDVDPFGDGSGIALWQFDGDLTEVSGTYSAYFAGEDSASLTFGPGKFNDCLMSSVGLKASVVTDLEFYQEYSVSCWFKSDPVLSSIGLLFHSSILEVPGEEYCGVRQEDGDLIVYQFGRGLSFPLIDYSDNLWHHLVVVFSGDTGNTMVYIDGIEVSGIDDGDNYDEPTNFLLISGIDSRNESWNGDIDQFRVFNRPLTSEEVIELYNETIVPPNPNDLFLGTIDVSRFMLNNTELSKVMLGNILLWSKQSDTPPGSIIFDIPGNYQWTRPSGWTEFQVCMAGGGGSGGKTPTGANGSTGGYAGGSFGGPITTLNDPISIYVGAGGEGVDGTGADGRSGGLSGFDTVNVAGGAGGNGDGYYGEGDGHLGCDGMTYYDGLNIINSWGGAASVFSNGGDGEYSSNGSPGGTAAGGGGAYGGANYFSGSGGDGEVRISWGNYKGSPLKLSEMSVIDLQKYGIKKVD